MTMSGHVSTLMRAAPRRGVIRLSQTLMVALATLLSTGNVGAQPTVETLRAFEYPISGTPARPNNASLTLLPDGRWLIVGGTSSPGSIRLAEPLPSSAGSTQQNAPIALINPRSSGHTATVLPDGTVLITGGTGPDGTLVPDAELFDPMSLSVRALVATGLTPRTHHTATLLTNGLVLLAGGLSDDGTPVELSELYDPRTQKSQLFGVALLTPRFDHSAALLSGGEALVWGGQAYKSSPALPPEAFDPLQSLFSAIAPADSSILQSKALLKSTPQIADTLPQAGAADVSLDARVAIRFTRPVSIATINSTTVTLVGPSGAVQGKVAGTEAGMLGFFSPTVDLSPGATYTLFVNGVTDQSGAGIPFSAISFNTRVIRGETSAASQASSGGRATQTLSDARASGKNTASLSGGSSANPSASERPQTNPGQNETPDDNTAEDWVPSDQNRHGAWRVLGLPNDPVLHALSLRISAPVNVLPSLSTRAASTPTGVTGQVLRLNGKPLAGVSISVAGQSTVTDSTGRFTLEGALPSGTQILKVDGTGVFTDGRHYTEHFIQVQMVPGEVTPLADVIYLPRVDPATEVNIPSPSDREIVLTHPSIPGLEVHIPKGAVLREYDGKVVTKLSITPVPVDRAPYPAPTEFSVYFTLQPGGAFVEGDPKKAVKVIYPNYKGLAPGSIVDFWNYDPHGSGWKVYGRGVVSKDGKQVVPDRNVGFRQIMTFGFGVGNGTTGGPAPAATAPVHCGQATADPVDCATGIFTHTVTDMVISDVMPISVTRAYRPNDPVSRSFGIGTSLSYAMYLYTTSTATPPATVQLIMADSSRINFYLQSGTTLGNAVWQNTDALGEFAGAVMTGNSTTEVFNVTTGNGTVYTFGTHPYNQLKSITDSNGNSISFTFSSGSSGNITQITSQNGRYVQLSYDSCNRITQAIDNIGRSVSYFYDNTACTGRLSSVQDMDGYSESYGYTDPADATHLTTITDKRGNLVTTNLYDTSGRVFQQTLADGTFWQFNYTLDSTNAYIAQTQITDPRGNVEVMQFNAAGYVTSKVLAQGLPEQQSYSYAYYPSNQLQTITDPLGRITKFTYNTFGSVTAITRLYGTSNAVTRSFVYDPTTHRLSSYKDELTHTWTFGRDTLGNLTSITDPLNNVTSIVNNYMGMPTKVTDPLQHAIQIGYQQADVASLTNALGNTTHTFTDGAGETLSLASALGHQEGVTLDAMGRITQYTDPMSGSTSVTYDHNGNTLTVTDPRNLSSHVFTYDARNRLQTYTDPLQRSQSYTPDAMSNLHILTDAKGQQTQYTYDGLNRPHIVQYQDGSTVTLNWDGASRLMSAIDSVSGQVSWTYDQLDNVTSETTPNGTVSYTYFANGLRQTMTASTQAQLFYCYDLANRLTSIVNGSCASPTSKLVSLTYDQANRRQTMTLPNGAVTTYAYDNANELTGLTYTSGSTTLGTVSYSYDADGRRTSRISGLDQAGASPSVGTTAFDAANELSTWGAQSLTYDLNGNLVSDGVNTYTWNARNQLVGISGGVSAAFTYDALGRRLSRQVGSTTTNFIYDRLNLVQETSGGSVVADYLVGLQTDETYARTSSSVTQSFLRDGLGSTVALLSSSGGIATTYNYDAYGNVTVGGAASANPLQYAGRENDGTGLYYNRARYYSPLFGRFVSADPIGLQGGTNLYAYVQGNPVSYVDPFGYAPGDPFSSIQNAAVDALNWVYQTYPTSNNEYAGTIYQGTDGMYYATAPLPGVSDSSTPSYPPGGYRQVDAYYHTHGQCTKGMNGGNDVFSPDDKFVADWHLPAGVPSFLETPGHRILQYDPDPKRNGNGTVSTVQPGCDCRN
jgi:RHS repeat-associated protein